jgi:hypothetical protein
VQLDLNIYPIKRLPYGGILFEDRVQSFGIGPGDDVFIIGRFINREGHQKNTPSVRFGNIAQMPGEPIIDDDGIAQESYLVEARSIPGYSGAPVFVHIPIGPGIELARTNIPEWIQEEIRKQQGINEIRWRSFMPMGPYLLGVDFCHINDRIPVRSAKTREQMHDWYIRSILE